MNAYTNQYQNNQILNASPEQILIMLYDGAIRFCREAQQAIESQDKRRMSERISRAMAIVSELSNTLDHEVGGEVAENLDALYGFMMRELTRSNLEKDSAGLKTVEALLADLRGTWVEAIEINRKEKNPSQEAGYPSQPAASQPTAGYSSQSSPSQTPADSEPPPRRIQVSM